MFLYDVICTQGNKKHLLHAIVSHIWKLHFNWIENLVLWQRPKPAIWGERAGSEWVEEGKAPWMGLTLVHRAETFPGSEGNQVGGKPEQKLSRVPPHSPLSQLHSLTTLSCPQPSWHLTTLGSILPYTLKTREPAHSNNKERWWGDWTSLGQSWVTNTSSELRQGDTVKSLPTRGIKVNSFLILSALKNAHLQS